MLTFHYHFRRFPFRLPNRLFFLRLRLHLLWFILLNRRCLFLDFRKLAGIELNKMCLRRKAKFGGRNGREKAHKNKQNKVNETGLEYEFMQNLFPVGSGPSSKTWPKCPPHFLHNTSVLCMNKLLSAFISTLPLTGEKKLGQPVPESYFVSEENNSLPQAAHTYMPFSLLCSNFPVNGCSVPFSLRI